MKSLRRFTSGIVASFDWMISQVENHEALINGSIRDVNEAGARAKVHLARVKQDGIKMRTKLSELREAEDAWAERARKSAKLDEKRAIECLKRRKRVQRELADLEVQEREHAKLDKQLTEDLSCVEDRLTQLKQQRNLMRTRQSRAEALGTLRRDDSHIFCEIDDIFDRWEMKVAEYELNSSCTMSSEDDLESEFLSEEEEDELKLVLQELVADAS